MKFVAIHISMLLFCLFYKLFFCQTIRIFLFHNLQYDVSLFLTYMSSVVWHVLYHHLSQLLFGLLKDIVERLFFLHSSSRLNLKLKGYWFHYHQMEKRNFFYFSCDSTFLNFLTSQLFSTVKLPTSHIGTCKHSPYSGAFLRYKAPPTRGCDKYLSEGRFASVEADPLPRSGPATDDLKSRVEFAGGT